MKPSKIRRLGHAELAIDWADGHSGRHNLVTLRKYCPCASCKLDAESGEPSTLLPIITQGQYDLKSIEKVGNYALQLGWGDGHRTGIFTFDYLRQICECDECGKTSAE